MSARDDWATGWHAGNEYGTATVHIPIREAHEQRSLDVDEPLDQPNPPAVDPMTDFDLEAWEDGYSTGYAQATGGDGGAGLRANPYRR